MPGKLFLLVGTVYMEEEEELVLLRRWSFLTTMPNATIINALAKILGLETPLYIVIWYGSFSFIMSVQCWFHILFPILLAFLCVFTKKMCNLFSFLRNLIYGNIMTLCWSFLDFELVVFLFSITSSDFSFVLSMKTCCSHVHHIIFSTLINTSLSLLRCKLLQVCSLKILLRWSMFFYVM